MSLNVNDLCERVQFYGLEKISDDMGGWVEKWSPGRTVWAQVEGLSSDSAGGGTMTKAKRLGVLETTAPLYRLTFRSSVDLRGVARVLWRKQLYALVSEVTLSPDKSAKTCVMSLVLPGELPSEGFSSSSL